ncbi:MAG: DUF1800 domain-containing protein [Nocardioides sp.]
MPKPVKLSAADQHFVNRFTYGYSRATAKQVKKAGGGRQWFEQQLTPKNIKNNRAKKLREWYPSLKGTPQQLWQRREADGYSLPDNLARLTIQRRIQSKAQLHEIMTEFWANLLHVPIGHEEAYAFRVAYEKMIRRNALKRFDKMLYKATIHGAMGLFLDNAYSTKDAPNENLGREVLELHTVGVGHYTEKEVKASTRILTGWRIDMYDQNGANINQRYEPEVHDTKRVSVLDFRAKNANPDGRKLTKKYLKYLAHHPLTAKRIAQRLCVRFVDDNPSKDLVRTVARAYTRNKTEIKPTLLAMVNHPEFARARGKKVRTPGEDFIATIRALGPKVQPPANDESFANQLVYYAKNNGQSPYDWGGPDGYPENNKAWSTPGRVLDTMEFHRAMVGSGFTNQVAFKPMDYWRPKKAAKFRKVINRASRLLHGHKASKKVRKAIAIRTGIALGSQLTPDQVTDQVVQQMLASLLDSPAQMIR